MKRIFTLLLCLALFVSCMTVSAGANSDITVEYLEGGGYIVTHMAKTRETETAHKTSTYFSACNIPVFTATVSARFSCTEGEEAEATDSQVRVAVFEDSARFIDKTAVCDGNQVYSYVYVDYLGITRVLSPQITCDQYGNLS